MSVYPRNLSTFLNRLSGYNKNNVKMNVLGNLDATAGDTIQVDLPTNSIVDLSSLAWAFTVTYGPSGKDNESVSPPIQCEGLISRLAIEVNGQTLCNLTNYNHLFHALLYMSATEDYQLQRLVAQSNSAPDAGGAAVAFANDAGGAQEHVIDSWVGFLGSAKPNFIDTSLLGNVRITITLAGAEVFSKSNAGCTPTYTISDQHFSMDVVSISDGIYDAMVDQMLASGAPLEIPFKNYFSFTDRKANMDHQFNFHVASQSIDRLWAVPRAVLGNEAGGVTATDPVHEIVATDNGVFRYATCQGQSFQFQVNNTLYPNWSSTKAVDWWQHTKLAVGDQGNMLAGAFPQAMRHYTNHFFVYACSLEHQTDGDERFMSGIDTRGAAASCMFKSAAGGAVGGAVEVNNLFIFAECTSSLKIMANKVLEIVQ